MPGHTHLLAVLEHWTGGAPRQSAGAYVFAERNEQRVELDPAAPRYALLESCDRLLWSARFHEAPAIGYAVHVHIDTDPGLSAGDAERQVRALRADTGHGCEHIEVAG